VNFMSKDSNAGMMFISQRDLMKRRGSR